MGDPNEFKLRKFTSIMDARIMARLAFEKREKLDLDLQFFQDNFLSFALSCKSIAHELVDPTPFLAWLETNDWALEIVDIIKASHEDKS